MEEERMEEERMEEERTRHKKRITPGETNENERDGASRAPSIRTPSDPLFCLSATPGSLTRRVGAIGVCT